MEIPLQEADRLEPQLPNQSVFANTLMELAKVKKDLVVVTSDSRGSGKLGPFGEAFPDQMVEIGIAEQNLVGVAAGLASAGKRVIAVSPACFLTARSLEQIKNDICYSDHPVTLVGISAGVSYGALGTTHHSLHDFAAFRAMHNLIIGAPADNRETREALLEAVEYSGPVYLRLGKKAVPAVRDADSGPLRIGKAERLRDGSDIAFIATGEVVHRALRAASILEGSGITAQVVSVPFIRPLDREPLLQTAKAVRAVITIEEHSVHGGLGEACASLFLQNRLAPRFRIMGIPDEDTVTGSGEEILDHYGISGTGIARAALELLQK